MKKISILPLIFFIICLLIFPFKLIQMVSIFVILIYAISFIISKLMYYSLNVARGRSVYYVQSGSSEISSLEILNKGVISLDNIFIQDKGAGCYESGTGLYMESIIGGSRKVLKTPINSNTRGHFKVGPVIIKGCDPLTLFPWTKTANSYSDIYIYPKFSNLDLLLVSGDPGGRQKVLNNKYEDQLQLESMRDFRAGDPLKKVNWRASARAGTLQTMEYSNTLSASLTVLMDVNPDNYPLKNRYFNIERTIEAAASLLKSYSDRSESISIYLNSTKDAVYIPPGIGYEHTISALQKLSEIDFNYLNSDSIIRGAISRGIRIPSGSHIYILTPMVTAEINREILLLRKINCYISVISCGGKQEQLPPDFCNNYILKPYGKEFF